MSRGPAACILVAAVLALGGCAGSEGDGGSGTDAGIPDWIAAGEKELAGTSYRLSRQRTADAARQGRMQEALEASLIGLNLAPHAREPYATVSSLCLRTGQDALAVQLFDRATQDYPAVPHGWFYLGFHRARLNDWSESAQAFDRAAALDRDHAETHFRLGVVRHTLGEFDAALVALSRAAELEPANASYATRFARALRIVGDYDEAARVIDGALARTPDSAELHYGKAQLLVRAGDDAGAEASLRRALDLDATLGAAQRDLAGVLQRAGRDQEARRAHLIADRLAEYERRRAVLVDRRRLIPEHPEVPLLLAELETTHGNHDAALRWLSQSRALGGDARRIAAAFAWSLLWSGRSGEAQQPLAELDGWNEPAADLVRAAAALLAGDESGAQTLVRRALSPAPDDQEFLLRASDLLLRLGREQESFDLLQRAAAAPHTPSPEVTVASDASIAQP